MRQKIVAGNWKMNKSLAEGETLVKEIIRNLAKLSTNKGTVILFPPFIHLPGVSQSVNQNIHLGGQNCSQKKSGAYTGEISADMLVSCGCEYVLIGHSERRTYFHESDEILNEKIDQALKAGLKPVFCCGESLGEREKGNFKEVISQQLSETVFKLKQEEFSKCVIAYEPVWAIGTGRTATSAQAQEVHSFIRKEIGLKFGNSVAESASLLYGGSCNASNAAELFAQPDIDGGLIGGASLVAEDFVKIVASLPS